MVKNCDLGLENAARGLANNIYISQPANNISYENNLANCMTRSP